MVWPQPHLAAMAVATHPVWSFPASLDRRSACPEMVAAALWQCRRLEATSPDLVAQAAAPESATAMDPAAVSPALDREQEKKAPALDPIPMRAAEFPLIPAPAVQVAA